MGLGCSRCGQLVSSVSALAVPRLLERERMEEKESWEVSHQGWMQMSRHTERDLHPKGSSGPVGELLKLPGVLVHFWVLWRLLNSWVCEFKLLRMGQVWSCTPVVLRDQWGRIQVQGHPGLHSKILLQKKQTPTSKWCMWQHIRNPDLITRWTQSSVFSPQYAKQ